METLIRFVKNSGPGWLQAAVTLGGGTLVSALYLGVVGGFNFLWLQPLAMFCGVIMLAALSYITLSQNRVEDRPFRLVQNHISPALAWGWLLATILANVVFCASQFALGTDAIQGNLGFNTVNPFIITSILAIVAMALLWGFSNEGKVSETIQNIIKLLVALIVLAFLAVVGVLMVNGQIDWNHFLKGFIPNFGMLFKPVDSYSSYLQNAGNFQQFWTEYISSSQRNIIIGAFGTAVGINMTFLLPYTIYKKKWNKSHRKFSRYDLAFGLLIPFIISASCLIIATASQFHAQEKAIVSDQAYFEVLDKRLAAEYPKFAQMPNSEKNDLRAIAPKVDRQLSKLLAKRSAHDLAEALTPLLGQWSQFIFGIGILAMALSTMLVHMMINGYAFSEISGSPGNKNWFLAGAAIPAISGCLSPIIWSGSIKAAIVVPASVIATTLLPVAYLAFVLMMNSKKVLGNEQPKKMLVINILMMVSLLIAYFAACWALIGKYQSSNTYEHYFGIVGLIVLIALSVLGIIGFFRKQQSS